MHKARRMTIVALAAEIALASAYAQDNGTSPEREAEASASVQSNTSPHSALTLGTASLTNAWKESGISMYRCAALFQDFGKAIATANGNAAAKRAQLDAATWKLLETGMAKAQADGNLNLHLAYRAAFDSGLETLKGDNAEIVKIRAARAKRLAQIDADLRAAGVTAAHSLHAGLEYQKAEMTKKGDIETAVKVVGFQQKVAEWGKNPQTLGLAAAISSANDERPATQPLARRTVTQQQARQRVGEIKTSEPEGEIITIDSYKPEGTSLGLIHAGDVVKIQYVDGEWSVHEAQWMESPDGETLRQSGSRVILAESGNSKIPVKSIPPNTKEKPFEFVVQRTGTYLMRINDAPEHCGDNMGAVRYSVTIIPGKNPNTTLKPKKGSAFGRVTNHTLTGTQTEESITLAKTAQPHVVREQYIVPEGKELLVEAGATIVFERGASLHCEGTLRMNGSEQAPIVCKGKMQTVGYWSGIRLRSEDAIMDWVQISGAVEAIQINKSPSILNCAICRNEKSGIHVGMNCAGGDARIVNCLIANNGKKGIDCHHGRATLENCTITENGETGLWVGYSGHVKASACKIEGNKGRGCCFDAGGQGDVHNSSITGNKGFDIEYTGGGASDFRECYWGTSITRMLQQRGDGANLPNIKDGRDTGDGNTVNVAEFLTEPPKDCGATVKF